ncbi:ABC transporter substrate-binding protein [Lederbergia ruris]|uniref:ABC transporter substrate-binding protein n=1 Tax=Lederbergia ruris TaxID=217495 RepID=A0ABQ4KNR2_9BACI|nr:sugar ABC transporter substrate-binding protein [Lederbergia ruris]GIN59527.1 ABC transporter substrate-binding protein [Lederbergia ruris]
MRKISFILLLVSLIACLLVACSNGKSGEKANGKTVNLNFSAWGNPEELKVYNRAVDAFNEKHDDIQVKLTGIPNDNYFQTLLTRLQGGQAPDVFYVGDADVSTLVNNGTIEPLSDFLETDASYVKEEDFTTDIWGGAKKDDVIYALSVDSNPYVLYYNKNLLKEVGAKSPQEYYDEGKWNWEAMEEITSKLRDAGYYGFVQGGAHTEILNWVWSNGGEFTADGKVVADEDDNTLEAFEFIGRMIENKNFIFGGTLPEGQGADSMFMSNQVGLVTAGRWFTPMFLKTNIDFDYIPFPSNTDEPIGSTAIATAYLAVNSKSDHIQEAMEFVSYYTSTEGQKTRLDGEGNAVPSVLGIDEVVTNQEKPEHGEYLLDAREKGAVVSDEFTAPGLGQELADIYEVFLIGDISAEEAVQQAADVARKMLENK